MKPSSNYLVFSTTGTTFATCTHVKISRFSDMQTDSNQLHILLRIITSESVHYTP